MLNSISDINSIGIYDINKEIYKERKTLLVLPVKFIKGLTNKDYGCYNP